jgi:serine/threonine protein kinase
MEIVGEIRHDRQHQIGVGEGMNSTVFKAFDPQLGGEFAIKVIPKSMFGGDITKYFEEAQAMFATAHRNIVPIQYACQTASDVMLAMPYFARGSLAARISAGPITTKELIRIAVGVLHGVTQIHNAGYIHFDLKPSNVLFNDIDDPLVADFGQTRKILPGGAVSVPRMYHRAMPPETLTSGAGSLLGDIYQLGLLLYRAINGDRLYHVQFLDIDDATMERLVIAGRLPDRKMFLPHVPKRIRTIIRKALKPDPAERYQSANEFSKVVARIPVGLNWNTTIDPSGEIRWRAERPGKTDLEVRLLKMAGTWSVRAWTVNGTRRRATGSGALNRSGVDHTTAMAHLNGVFAQMV